jgi:hypothetical protein
MINRRFMIVSPALPSGGYAEKLKRRATEFLCLHLEMANMRVHRFYETNQLRGILQATPHVVALPGN